MLTQKDACALFSYDPDTGQLTRKTTRCGRAMKGSIAGYIRTLPYGPNGYKQHVTKVDNKPYTTARLIWLIVYGEWPDCIDHINQDPADNRLINLRNVSFSENLKNRPRFKSNSSGIPGVHWHKESRKWLAKIGGKDRIYLGLFDNFFDACCVRKSAENKYGYHPNHGT